MTPRTPLSPAEAPALYTAPAAFTAPDADSPRAYMDALRRHLTMIAALAVGAAVVAGLGSMLRPRKYVARAAFLASEPGAQSGSLGALSSVASQLGLGSLGAVAASSASVSAQFYGDLLTSQALLSSVVTTRYEAPGDTYGGDPFTGTLVDYTDPSGTHTAADKTLAAMKIVAQDVLGVAVDRPTGIVRLEVHTKNRRLSALVARRFLDLVNEFNLRRRQTQAGNEREFDAHRAQASLDSLRVAETALAAFRETNIDFSRSPRLATREAELQRRVSLAQQIYTTVAQRYELANIEAVRNTPVITVLDAPEELVQAESRHTLAIAAAGGLLGALVGATLALRRERLAPG